MVSALFGTSYKSYILSDMVMPLFSIWVTSLLLSPPSPCLWAQLLSNHTRVHLHSHTQPLEATLRAPQGPCFSCLSYTASLYHAALFTIPLTSGLSLPQLLRQKCFLPPRLLPLLVASLGPVSPGVGTLLPPGTHSLRSAIAMLPSVHHTLP